MLTKKPIRAVVLLATVLIPFLAAPALADSLIGRWDIVVRGHEGEYPSWMEVRLSGNSTLVGSYVGQFGSARPIATR